METKRKFKLQGLDCANCTTKIEEAARKIESVSDATVNFMTQKITIEVDDSKFDEIMREVVFVYRKVEPDYVIQF